MKADGIYVGFKIFLVSFSCLFLLNTVLPDIVISNHKFAIENNDLDEKESEEKNEELKEKLQAESPLFCYIVFQKCYYLIDKARSFYTLHFSDRFLPVLNPPPDQFR